MYYAFMSPKIQFRVLSVSKQSPRSRYERSNFSKSAQKISFTFSEMSQTSVHSRKKKKWSAKNKNQSLISLKLKKTIISKQYDFCIRLWHKLNMLRFLLLLLLFSKNLINLLSCTYFKKYKGNKESQSIKQNYLLFLFLAYN